MNKKSQVTIGLALLIMASLLCGSANALGIPVTDSMNTKSTIKNWFTNLKESKVVVSTMNTAKKTSAAIGTAKKAVSEYVLENKKKIEEKMAKVKEYKEKAEKYKKDYEKYKAELDEGIAKAKEMKEKAEEGIQTAKDTAAAAKGMAETAKGMADAAKDKVSSKLGIEKDGTENSAGGDNAAGSIAENQLSDGSEPNVLPAAGVTAGTQTAPAVVQKTPSVSKVTASRRPFGGAAVVAGGSPAVVSGGAAGLSGSMSVAAPVTQVSGVPADGMVLENVGTAVKATEAVPAEAAQGRLSGTGAAENSAANTLVQSAAKDLAASKAVEPLESAVNKVSALQKVGASASAVQPQVQSVAVPVSDVSPVRSNIGQAVRTPAAEAKLQVQGVKGRVQDIKEIQVPASGAAQAVPLQNTDKLKRKSLRRSFTTSSLESFGRISSIAPVGFAYALELPDDCSDVNGTRVFSRSTCMYCNLSSAKAKKEGAIDECLLSINAESSKAQAYSGRDAPKAYLKGKLEIAAAMIAESYRAANKAETFYDNKVAPIAEAPEAVEQDALANLVEFNKVIDEQLNDLMQLYSSKLALQAYMNYGKYNFQPEGEENEE